MLNFYVLKLSLSTLMGVLPSKYGLVLVSELAEGSTEKKVTSLHGNLSQSRFTYRIFHAASSVHRELPPADPSRRLTRLLSGLISRARARCHARGHSPLRGGRRRVRCRFLRSGGRSGRPPSCSRLGFAQRLG